MLSLGTPRALTDDQRRENDRHRPVVVLLALLVLAVYAYLFTHIADDVGLPRPAEIADRIGISVDYVFNVDDTVDSEVAVTMTDRLDSSADERLTLFGIVALAFLSSYFLPLGWKQASLVSCSVTAIWVLFGSQALAGLAACHLAVYVVCHPNPRSNLALSALAAILFGHAFDLAPAYESTLLHQAQLALSGAVIYRGALLPLLQFAPVARLLRTCVVQSAILVVFIGAFAEGFSGDEWELPLGVILFFWHWERLILYHCDFKDGLVPKDLSATRYLAVFFQPAGVANWNWGVSIAQGYDYTQTRFLCEDKNRIVLSGVGLSCVALGYLVAGSWIRQCVIDFCEAGGVEVYGGYTRRLVSHFSNGGDVAPSSVLVTTLVDLGRWILLWGGVVHFKVAVWRLCGYQVETYFNRPWAATNLAAFWSRFTFHYRAFLVRAFYYPVFFRWFKRRPVLRVFVATIAAAGLGNMVWGHMTERMFYRGMRLENFDYELAKWPYYLLLGTSIACVQLWQLKRPSRRKPWSRDPKVLTDLLCAYCTLQFFALLRIFARPVDDSTIWDRCRLFLTAFGID